MDDIQFPIMIVYKDNNQISIISSFKEVEAARAFVVLKTHCILIQWTWFFAGMLSTSFLVALYYFLIWGQYVL